MKTVDLFERWISGVPLLRGKPDNGFRYWLRGAPLLVSAKSTVSAIATRLSGGATRRSELEEPAARRAIARNATGSSSQLGGTAARASSLVGAFGKATQA